jgi:hypothetical protein
MKKLLCKKRILALACWIILALVFALAPIALLTGCVAAFGNTKLSFGAAIVMVPTAYGQAEVYTPTLLTDQHFNLKRTSDTLEVRYMRGTDDQATSITTSAVTAAVTAAKAAK